MQKMKYKKSIVLFFRFLKEKGAYDSYMQQCEKFVKNRYNVTVITELDMKVPNDYIAGFFSWMCSNEGYKYWSSLNREWIYYYRKKYGVYAV